MTGDEVYGNHSQLRTQLQAAGLGYVLAVSCRHRFDTPTGPITVAALAADMPAAGWQKRPAGQGTKGPRWYSWALTTVPADGRGQQWILLRRNDTTGELAYYRCYHPTPFPLAEFVAVAGTRWKIEESFQTAKGQVGLDQHQLRQRRSWHRFTVLAMLVLAFLAIATADHNDRNTTHRSSERTPPVIKNGRHKITPTGDARSRL